MRRRPLVSPWIVLGLLLSVHRARAADRKVVEVGTAKGVPGQTVRGSLVVAEAADGSPVELPIAIVTGREDGPVVWVEASAHGDEYGGPRALQGLVRSLDPAFMKGSVVAVMISNPPAFRALQRVNPNLDDLEDFGDAFPGRDRFATERIAAAIFANVKRVAGYFVDLHTGGDRFRQLPFVFYSVTGTVPAERYEELARSFGVPTLWRDTAKVFASDATTIFSAAGIPSFLLEVGGGQPLDPADLSLQADVVRGLLRKVGVLPGEAPRLGAYTVVTGYRIVTNARGGFFEAAVKPGDRVHAGSVLGRVFDVYGDAVETMTAPAGTDIVLGVSTYPAAATGGWLFELGDARDDAVRESRGGFPLTPVRKRCASHGAPYC
jgi:predicted deacylase